MSAKNKLNFIQSFFQGNKRTVKAKKNIVASLMIKGISIVVGFLTIRVTLDYLDQSTYGIWLTLSSFLGWFGFFNIGLGNGLQNKLAEALSLENPKLGRIYVSTTYAILTIVICTVALVFFIVNFFIDWSVILNTDADMAKELYNLSNIVFGFFFLRFVLKLINIILMADQRPAMANSFGPIGNLITLLIIYILTLTTDGSLFYLGLVLSIVPTLILIIASIYFYNYHYSFLSPSLKYVDLKYAKDLLGLGIKFFIIQISGLVVYQSSNIIIAQMFGTEEVVTYNVGYKYFSLIAMGFTIIISPFWAAYTEAWTKKEIGWIKNSVSKLLYVWAGISFIGIIMLVFANPFYSFWLGNKIEVPFKLSLTLLVYFITLTFGGVFKTFLNGAGYVKLQMYSSILASIIFILSSLLMIKYFNWGMESILIAMILSNFYGIIIAPIHYKKIINNQATGIWKL